MQYHDNPTQAERRILNAALTTVTHKSPTGGQNKRPQTVLDDFFKRDARLLPKRNLPTR